MGMMVALSDFQQPDLLFCSLVFWMVPIEFLDHKLYAGLSLAGRRGHSWANLDESEMTASQGPRSWLFELNLPVKWSTAWGWCFPKLVSSKK